MKRVFCIIAAFWIFSYLLASKADWFAELARSSVARNPLFSRPLDLSKRNTFTWEVPTHNIITRNGQAELSLVLNLFLLTEIPLDRSHVELKAKVSAYAQKQGKKAENRLIINERFNTDEPFEMDNQMGVLHGGGRLEYVLAAIDVRDGEILKIQLSITTPDPGLASGNPRLKLVGDHDHAGTPWEFLFQDILVNWGFYISLMLLFGLFLVAWGTKKSTKPQAGGGEKRQAETNPSPREGAFFEKKNQ